MSRNSVKYRLSQALQSILNRRLQRHRQAAFLLQLLEYRRDRPPAIPLGDVDAADAHGVEAGFLE